MCYFSDLNLISYRTAWEMQLQLVSARRVDRLKKDIVLFLEHPPVFTMGRRGGKQHLKISDSFLEQSGIDIFDIERGGDITYHGPGQLVVYPIIKLGPLGLGVVDFVGFLEEVMIQTVSEWSIKATRNPLNRGIWIGDHKLGSIGIAIRHGISFHGFALNVSTDLLPFSWINPCGLTGIRMTSMALHSNRFMAMTEVKAVIKRHWEKLFNVTLEAVSPDELLRILKETD